jgi:hypothetical protein
VTLKTSNDFEVKESSIKARQLNRSNRKHWGICTVIIFNESSIVVIITLKRRSSRIESIEQSKTIPSEAHKNISVNNRSENYILTHQHLYSK